MSRLSSALLMAAAVALVGTSAALAAGSYTHKEPIKASVLPTLPSLPTVTLEQSFNGCGGRRIRDPHTGACRGPAEIGH
jgi:hypothetical protein